MMSKKIIRVMGGLGNQMFQYALLKSLESTGFSVKADISWFEENKLHNGFELMRIFELQITLMNSEEVSNYLYKSVKTRGQWPNYLLHRKGCYVEKTGYPSNYSDDVSTSAKSYYFGYWQNEKYFKDIKQQILECFSFPELDEENRAIAGRIKNCNSVAIHVRRGDYIKNSAVSRVKRAVVGIYLNNLTQTNYYRTAVKEIGERVEAPTFFVFSDDTAWCQENLFKDTEARIEYVTQNVGERSYIDMQLMSMCRHMIIANSTFSWWAAWLNQCEDKIVIAPKDWFGGRKRKKCDIQAEGWVLL